MKNSRLVIRIDENKKNELAKKAKEMKLDSSKVVNCIIDEFISNDTYIELNITKKQKVACDIVALNDLCSRIENNVELKNEILKKLGDLECLL